MRLKELRKQKKLRQSDVAEVINCSQAVYSRYESGERAPSMDTLKTLADFYGVTIDYLSGHDDLHHTAWEEPGSGIKRAYQYAPEDVHVTGNFGQGKSKLAAESAQAFQQLDPDRTRYAEQLRAREHFGPTYQPKDQITVTATGPDGVTQQLMQEAVHYIGQKPLTPAEEAEQIRQDLIAKLRSMTGDKLVRISQYADLLKQQEDMEKEAKRNELR